MKVSDLEIQRIIDGSDDPFEIYCYKKGRTDAIEECVKLVESFANHIDVYADELMQGLKRLKEQKNE